MRVLGDRSVTTGDPVGQDHGVSLVGPVWASAGRGGLQAGSHPIDGCGFVETVRCVAQPLQAVLEKGFVGLPVAAVAHTEVARVGACTSAPCSGTTPDSGQVPVATGLRLVS